MANTKKPTDFTGRKIEELKKQQLEDQSNENEAADLAARQAKVDLETQVINATEPSRATVIVDEVITVSNPENETVVIRVVDDIEAMTFGAGSFYSFKAGVKYEVPKTLANHLQAKGYISNAL